MQCPVCHNEVGSQATFCNHCGASLAAAPPAAPAPGYTQVPPAYTPPSAGYAEVPPAYIAPPTGYAPPPAGYAPPPQQNYPPQPASAASSGLTPNSAAAVAYITFIPAIIFLVIEPYNKIPLVRFHSIQSIGLAVVAFVLQVGVTVLEIFLHFLPGMFFLITMIFSLLHLAIALLLFIVWLMAIIKASKGEWYKIPLIGDFAMKQAQS
jgi:uncharacterized membrane protein